jgi:hypothetical protein
VAAAEAAGLVPIGHDHAAAELKLLARLGVAVPVVPVDAIDELDWTADDGPLLVWGGPGEHAAGAYTVELPAPVHAERAALWHAGLAGVYAGRGSRAAVRAELKQLARELAARFAFTEGDVAAVLERVRLDTAWCWQRSVRFYPRYDTEPSAIDEALSILRLAVEDLAGGRVAAEATTAPKIRVGTLAIPLETIEIVDLTPASFETDKFQILAVEQERYGAAAPYPPDVLRSGRRPLLQFPLETLEATVANPRAIGIALRDRVSGRFVGYALGSALENHDEEGVGLDPRFGENNTFYLQAMATLSTVQNASELENHLLESLRERALATGFEFLSTLIEDRLRETGPAWFRSAVILERIDNYLRSGNTFAYLQAALQN